MQIGRLRHRVKIDSISSSQDAYGQTGDAVHEEGTTPFAVVWGQVQDLSGRELLTAQEMHSEITSRVTIRFYPGVVASMVARVSMDRRERTFDIMAVTDPDGMRKYLCLECKERAT